jgi:hypothetical protein
MILAWVLPTKETKKFKIGLPQPSAADQSVSPLIMPLQQAHVARHFWRESITQSDTPEQQPRAAPSKPERANPALRVEGAVSLGGVGGLSALSGAGGLSISIVDTPPLLPEILLWWASPKVTPKVYLLSCAPHLLHEDDPLDSLQHHEQWGVCLTTGFVLLF